MAKGLKRYIRNNEKILNLRAVLTDTLIDVRERREFIVSAFETELESKKRNEAQRIITRALKAVAALGNALNSMAKSFDEK